MISHGLLLFLRWVGLITPTIQQKPFLCHPSGRTSRTRIRTQTFDW
jgi:hypothetical protein